MTDRATDREQQEKEEDMRKLRSFREDEATTREEMGQRPVRRGRRSITTRDVHTRYDK